MQQFLDLIPPGNCHQVSRTKLAADRWCDGRDWFPPDTLGMLLWLLIDFGGADSCTHFCSSPTEHLQYMCNPFLTEKKHHATII